VLQAVTVLTQTSLKRNNMTELFEDNQRDLERAVENLGYILQESSDGKPIAKLRQDITNQSVSRMSSFVTRAHRVIGICAEETRDLAR
jgi:hypothetical protein